MSLINREQTSRNVPGVDSDAILAHLTSRQHTHPHRPVGQVLEETIEAFGCCPRAIERGVEWLGIEPDRVVGRLRRSELVQLAKAVHRFWTQSVKAGETD